MEQLIKKLCTAAAVSGREDKLRDIIINEIKGHCEYNVDPIGNIIVFKKGKKRPQKKIMIDAHMDEVGLIITGITDSGFLKFATVGGIDVAVLLARRVKIGDLFGVITARPIHLCKDDDAEKLPKTEDLCIDIGAADRAEAEKAVSLGDVAVFDSDFTKAGDLIRARAIDDRAGCAVLTELIKSEAEYDFYAAFTCMEEVGLRGAGVAANGIEPDAAIVIEATTAADIAGVAPEKQVCKVGCGAAVSFMDRATIYDKKLYEAALAAAEQNGIKAQPKAAVSGGNNAGSISKSGAGVRMLALSVPCRYIHSPSCMASLSDIEEVKRLAVLMCARMAAGEC